MLLVTTTVSVVNWVHGNTTDLWPLVSLGLVLVVSTTSLEDWLVSTTTTGDKTNHSSVGGDDGLLGTGWKTDTGDALVSVVGDDDSITTGSTSEGTAVTLLGLDVADNSTLRDLRKRKDVTDGELSLLTSEDELAGVKTLRSTDKSVDVAVVVLILELDLGNWGTTTGIVDDSLDDT